MDSSTFLPGQLHLAVATFTRHITLAITVVLLLLAVVRYWRHPLRGVPGPALARLTGLWLLRLELTGKRATTVHELHHRYGPILRLAPNELSFSSPAALREIYGTTSKYAKAPVYESMGFQSTFTTRDRDEYRTMKKRILPNFSPSAIAALEPTVHKHVAALVKTLDKRTNAPIDIFPWVRMVALCVVGESFAAEDFGGLDREEPPEVLHEIDAVFPTLFVRWMFPITSAILQNSPFKAARDFINAAHTFRKYCSSAYTAYLASSGAKNHQHLVGRLINERSMMLEKGQLIPRHVTDDGIVDELTNLIFAGTDTTGSALTYLFWELAHHPEWQNRLRWELTNAIHEKQEYSYGDISDLPILDAAVQELFRLRPSAIGPLPRLVPSGGSIIDGTFVPGNTIVSCQALTVQREPSIFQTPDAYDPQRWLDVDNASELEAMRSQMMLFGRGSRACLGRTLAIMEIKCVVAAVIQKFTVEIGSSTTDEDMEMLDHFVLVAKGQKCVLKLSRI